MSEVWNRASIYIEKPAYPAEGEVFNPRFLYPEKTVAILQNLTDIRLVRSHTNGPDEIVPSERRGLYSYADFQKLHGLLPNEDADHTLLYPPEITDVKNFSDNIFITLSSGRKVLIASPPKGWENIFGIQIPDQVPGKSSDRSVISLKGIYSAYHTLTDESLKGTNAIYGLTGLTKDYIIEQMLTDQLNDVNNIFGDPQKKMFIPGRYFLYAKKIPFLRVLSSSNHTTGKTIDTKTLAPEEYPLLTGDNTPYAIVHLNWSAYTFEDIIMLGRMYKYLGDRNLSNQQKKAALYNTHTQTLRTIHQDLLYHPDYHENFSQMPQITSDAEFPVEFLTHFIIPHLNKIYMESQIAMSKKIDISQDISLQNQAFGGLQDFENAEIDPAKQSPGMHIFIRNSNLGVLRHLISAIGLFITDKQKKEVISSIHDQIAGKKSIYDITKITEEGFKTWI